MTRVKKLSLAALVALSLAFGAAYAPAQQLAGDPSQWGIESLAKKGSFDITESAISEEPLAAGDEKNGDVPVVPGLAGDPSQWG